jgi:AraC-like DNA-binding protein
MDDFCIHVDRLLRWLNTVETVPLTFAEPGFRQDLVTAPQPLIEMYLVTEGAMQLSVRERTAVLKRGELALANAHFGNVGRETGGPFRYGCISLDVTDAPRGPTARDGTAWTEGPFLVGRRAPDFERLAALYEEVSRLYHGPEHPHRHFLLKAALLQLLACAGDTGAGAQRTAGLQNSHVRRAIELMQEKRADPKLDLDRVARHARVSPSHLVRLFQSHLGTSPMRYLTQMRVRHAQGLLSRSQLTIKEIAYLVGFSDQLYFSRVFRQEFGMAPRDFRRVTPA